MLPAIIRSAPTLTRPAIAGRRVRVLVSKPCFDDACAAMDEQDADRTPDSGQAAGVGDVLSAREAGAVLGVSERTVRRAIAQGDLRATKDAGVYRIVPADLAHYETSRRRSALAV